MDVIDAGPDVAGVVVPGQRLDHLVAAARVLDRQHVRVQAIDGVQDVGKLRVAEVGHHLSLRRRDDCRKAEGAHRPVLRVG